MAFAFAGTELVGLVAAETANQGRTCPSCYATIWRITLFYVLALLIMGFLVPYTDERLLGASSADITSSPFVIAIENAGIKDAHQCSMLLSLLQCFRSVSLLFILLREPLVLLLIWASLPRSLNTLIGITDQWWVF